MKYIDLIRKIHYTYTWKRDIAKNGGRLSFSMEFKPSEKGGTKMIEMSEIYYLIAIIAIFCKIAYKLGFENGKKNHPSGHDNDLSCL